MKRDLGGNSSVALPGRSYRNAPQPGAACVALATPLPLAKYGRPIRGVPAAKHHFTIPSFNAAATPAAAFDPNSLWVSPILPCHKSNSHQLVGAEVYDTAVWWHVSRLCRWSRPATRSHSMAVAPEIERRRGRMWCLEVGAIEGDLDTLLARRTTLQPCVGDDSRERPDVLAVHAASETWIPHHPVPPVGDSFGLMNSTSARSIHPDLKSTRNQPSLFFA